MKLCIFLHRNNAHLPLLIKTGYIKMFILIALRLNMMTGIIENFDKVRGVLDLVDVF